MPFKLPCPLCKQSISFYASHCQYCTHHVGTGWQHSNPKKNFWIGAVVGLFFIPICVMIFNPSKAKDVIQSAYFGDGWWFGWLVMPAGQGLLLCWIIAYIRRSRVD